MVTVYVTEAVKPPEETVTVETPSATAHTSPDGDTVTAEPEAEYDAGTADAPKGRYSSFIYISSPTCSLRSPPETVIPVSTGITENE